MEFELKISEINNILRHKLKNKNNIIIRAGGIHTEKLLCMTCILDFWDKISIVDKCPHGCIGNKPIKGIDDIQWSLVDAVIISSLFYQNDIENELMQNKHFNGTIIKLYNEKEVSQFFELQKEYDFLTLEETKTWDYAVLKSGLGYAADSIFEYSHKDFIKHLNNCQNNIKYEKRNYYDILFYILKTLIQLKKKEIKILDFGGGFGSFYYDLKYYLKDIDIKFKWIIIEQKNIVDWAKQKEYITEIEFEKNLDNITEKESIDLVLFGGSIQYLKNYKETIQNIINLHPKKVAFLKTPVANETLITIQHTNFKGNYNHYISSYPCRIISEKELVEMFSKEYSLEDTVEDLLNPNNYFNNYIIKWKDFFFKKR